MENTERDQPSIDGDTFPSSDDESEESTDTELPTSIDAAQPEAGKFSLTKPANEKVVQTELNGQTSNETSQTEQGSKIPVMENSTLTKGEDIRLSIQDYLDPAQIDDNALSDTDDYSDEGTNCSDPYSVLHIDSFAQAYDTAVKSRTRRERFNITQALTGNRQVAEIATAIKRDAGCLPGRTDLNPRRQVSAVMLHSGKNLAADTRNNSDVGESDDADKTVKSNSHPILINDLDPNPSQENRKTSAEKAKEKAIDLELEEDTEIEDKIDRQYGTDVDRPKTPTIDRQPEKPVDRRSTQPEPIIERIDDNALSDTDDYLDEGTNCSDPYYVLHVDSFTQAYDTAVKSRQVAEIATAIKRDAGCLPGRTDLNQRRQVSVVMLRIGKNLAADTRNNTDVEKPDDTDKTGKINSHPILLNDLDPNPSQENRKTTAEKAKEKAIGLELEEDTEIEDEIDRQYRTDVDRPERPTIDRQPEKPIDDNALSDTDDYLDEGTNCSDPYFVLHVDSFTQAYDTAVKSRTGRERFNIRQALTSNFKTKSEFYGKINMVYGELMEKADSLGELIRKLEGQVAKIATAIKRDAGCLPGRTDLNPRRQVSAVMLRSGKNLAADTRNNTDVGKPDDTDKTGKSNSHPILLNDLDPNPSQENRKTTAEKAKEKAIDLELEEDTEIEDEIDRQYGTDVDRPERPTIDRQPEKPPLRRHP
ncbi:hypothetical protein DY000_02020166 [Brassica cretica]|uniref:Uncharacterized protein n=1 Tax=Brassica cretica TaxID=69181 RepID=A0ABQ7E2V5_BRACR|nr:hypothetical protein DY000_02020166 [Brassica cretica]